MILQRLGRALHLKGLYHRVAHHASDHHDDHDHPVVVVLSKAVHANIANIAKITSIAQGTCAETGNSAWEKSGESAKSVTCLKLLEINTLILLVKNLLTLLVEISFVGGFASLLDPGHRMTTVKLRRRPTMMICFEETGARYGRKVAFQTTNTIVFLIFFGIGLREINPFLLKSCWNVQFKLSTSLQLLKNPKWNEIFSFKLSSAVWSWHFAGHWNSK